MAAALAGVAKSAKAQRTDAISVATRDELVAAMMDADALLIQVRGRLLDVPQILLRPGQALVGQDGAMIGFMPGIDGLCLSSDNAVRDLELRASPERRAVFNDTGVASLGRIHLARLITTGQVQILARDQVRSGRVDADDVHVEAADTRDRPDRAKGFGVEVLQGAFTLWNLQADASVTIMADLSGMSAGQPNSPVIGGGIFVAGAGPGGGSIKAGQVETGAVHSDGRITPGGQARITSGVFILHGVEARVVRNRAPVATYGLNDMVLNNWGNVERWIAYDTITSFGASGVGFVNFGRLSHLQVEAPIETFGQGARGFNCYEGTVDLAEFDRIVTHGDGAVGIQISRPIGRIHVRQGVETFGGVGSSLVKGIAVMLSAIALSIKPGGSAHEIVVQGGLISHAKGIPPVEMLGTVDRLEVSGGLESLDGSDRP